MIVSIIGLGYIGLPTAAIIASKEVKVVGVDVNQHVLDTINKGNIHIIEPELDLLVHEAVKQKYLKVVLKPEKADVFIIAVPTPLKENYEPDLSHIESAVKAIAPLLEKGNLVILESTSPVGTTEKMVNWMRVERPNLLFPEFGVDSEIDVSVAYCPERVLPGHVIGELVKNDRIIGGITTLCAERANNLYKIFVRAQLFITDCRTAELSKLAENSYRDVNIAFANELSLICDKLDINVWELIKLSNRHPRVNILQPGPGVGGHCIAVDPWFIIDSSPNEAKLIRTARLVNDSKPSFVLDKINQAVVATGKKKSELSVACLGLTFKPDIDDLRESPALEIALQVSMMGFLMHYIVEPNIKQIPKNLDHINVKLVDIKTALVGSDIIVLLVDHSLFKSIDLALVSHKQVIDTRGTWS
jgi:UDP-N-acetyl-D-mannosaminuronic acid dehydrogenase